MKEDLNHDDIEFILEHLLEPERLATPEFREWLGRENHLELFEEVRRGREAWLNRELADRIDTGREFEHFRKRTGRVRLIRYSWIAAACVLFVGMVVLWQWNVKPEKMGTLLVQTVPVVKKNVELILASGENIQLERQSLELQAGAGVRLKNDTNQMLVYSKEGDVVGETLEYHTLKTPAGADYHVRLSDGTEVWLNCETTLKYPVNFKKGERRIFLDGQAYFKVVKARDWPFVVEADRMKVEVTGTSFDVKAYSGENEIHTLLVEGRVCVNNRVLNPSQQYSLDKITGECVVKEVEPELYLGWMNGMFVFRNQRLEEVMTELARWYGVSVFYATPLVKDIRFSGNLERYQTIDEMLNVIKLIDKVQIERRGTAVTIYAK